MKSNERCTSTPSAKQLASHQKSWKRFSEVTKARHGYQLRVQKDAAPSKIGSWGLDSELCKKTLVKTQQPGAGDIMHCDIGATEHYRDW